MTPESMTAPVLRDRVEEELIPVDLGREERVIGVESHCGQPALGIDVPPPQLPARSHHEMHDAVLRLDALVEVIVAGEDDGDVVGEEQRLEHRPQIRMRPVLPSR